jgi:hypothetical protein
MFCWRLNHFRRSSLNVLLAAPGLLCSRIKNTLFMQVEQARSNMQGWARAAITLQKRADGWLAARDQAGKLLLSKPGGD